MENKQKSNLVCLRVGNLTLSTDETDIIEYFSAFGPILNYQKRFTATEEGTTDMGFLIASKETAHKIMSRDHIIKGSKATIRCLEQKLEEKVTKCQKIIFFQDFDSSLDLPKISSFIKTSGKIYKIFKIFSNTIKSDYPKYALWFAESDSAIKILDKRYVDLEGKLYKVSSINMKVSENK